MQAPKILFITAEYSNHSCGGAGVYAYELTKAFTQKGIPVHVIIPGKRRLKQKVNENLTVESLPTIFLPAIRTPIYLLSIRRYVNEIIEREKVDVINGNHTVGAWIKTKTPMVTTLHHPARAENSNLQFIPRILNQLDILNEKVLINKSLQIIATCSQSQKLFWSLYPKQKQKILNIPIGIDTSFFKPFENARSKITSKHKLTDASHIVFVPGGARAKRKGLEYLLKAIDELNVPKVKYIVSGSSREIGWSNTLTKLVEKMKNKNQLVFVGEIDYSELSIYYSSADFIVFPSIFEGYGLPSLEALSCGVPVIATNTGEAENIIINGSNGLLVPPQNTEKLLVAIKSLIENKTLLNSLKKNARSSVAERYDWSAIYKKYIHMYEKVFA